jgi:hypothetical protein
MIIGRRGGGGSAGRGGLAWELLAGEGCYQFGGGGAAV